jgi:hypothetical protein
MRASIGLLAAALLALSAPSIAAAAPACDPMQTPAQFRGQVPKLEQIVPAPGGEGGEVTTDQAYAYMDAVDRSSERVITGALDQRSWQGRQLRWAIVGHRDRLRGRELGKIAEAAQTLRDPRTSRSRAESIARRYPAILWVASNVHGGEESGTDASLRVLYELADRDDCAARQILDNSIVVLLPIQNPDGRELNTRQNFYGFDMNRDWFARTQPETDGKVEMFRKLPGPLFIDDHEMGSRTFFFPPNADPIYHEITDESVDWINNVYGASLAAEFNRQGIPFFNRNVYDLFYMGYGDTVPATGFISAGMTFEKHNGDPIATRAYEQYVAQWVSLSQGAIRKRELLEEWASAWREAYQQGQAGFLEPNEIVNPGNEVVTEVPDRPVRHYFITERRDSKQREVQAMIRRLQRMDVEVGRLRKGLYVHDFTPYGREARGEWLPPGTWWVPMAQMQKHWVQAMLNEDTYTPFPYFYDVTAWSQPLLFNVRGGYSGQRLDPRAEDVRHVRDPGWERLPGRVPRIALWQMFDDSSTSLESAGWLRYLFERVWRLPYDNVTTAQVKAGALGEYDTVVVPNAFGPSPPSFPQGDAGQTVTDLGPDGVAAVRSWVEDGGHFVGWREGARLAALLGVSTVTLTEPTSDVPGSLFRVRMDDDSPLERGIGDEAYAFYEYDWVMRASSPSHVAVEFPPATSDDWFISGFAQNAEELGGTAAVVDEPRGEGRTTAFSVEPNFRAFTTGFQKILRNTLLSDEAGSDRVARAGAASTARSAARTRVLAGSGTIRLAVRPGSDSAAQGVLDRFGARYRVQRSLGRVAFLIAGPKGLSGHDHPFATRLPAALEGAGVDTIAFRAP